MATGDAIYAIKGDGNDNVLNLLPGSHILGRIDLGDGTDTVTISGVNGCATAACMSSSLTFEGSNVNINMNVPRGLVNGNVAVTIDPTGHSVLGVSLSTMTSAVHDVVSQRMARTPLTSYKKRDSSVWGKGLVPIEHGQRKAQR